MTVSYNSADVVYVALEQPTSADEDDGSSKNVEVSKNHFRTNNERELMFMFAICRRPSVCLSSVRLSVCRLSVVCNVRAPYAGD